MPYIGDSTNNNLTTDGELVYAYYYAADGDDMILFGNKNGGMAGWAVQIDGGNGNDILTGNRFGDTIFGGADNDIIYGNGGDDQLDGGIGDDTITGDDGNDTIAGGFGFDSIWGGAGNDVIDGGSGNDRIDGGAGADAISGGAGYDVVSYESASFRATVDLARPERMLDAAAGDTLESIEGVDGGYYGDVISGNSGNNILRGLFGNDLLDGREGHDSLIGGYGNDSLIDGAGNDYVNGGDGADTFYCGLGADVMDGEAGADRFIYTSVSQSGVSVMTRDTIGDLASGDIIDLRAIDANALLVGNQAFRLDTGGAFSAGEIRQVRVGSDLVLQFNTDGDVSAEMSIILLGRSSVSASFFLM